MAERFLNTNEFTLDELKGKADNANMRNSTKRWLKVWQDLKGVGRRNFVMYST